MIHELPLLFTIACQWSLSWDKGKIFAVLNEAPQYEDVVALVGGEWSAEIHIYEKT